MLPNIPSLGTPIFNLVSFVHPIVNFWRCTSLYHNCKPHNNGLGVFYLPLANALATCRTSSSLQTSG